MFDATTGAAKTGLTCTVGLSKAGAAFSGAAGAVAEISNGWYKVSLTTVDTNTLGDLSFYITAAAAKDANFTDQVRARGIDDLAFPATPGQSLAVDGTGALTLTTTERTAIATALLKLDWTGITGEAARSMLNALRFLRNKWSVSGTTLTVTKEDDTAAAWTSTISTDSNASPITASDPA